MLIGFRDKWKLAYSKNVKIKMKARYHWSRENETMKRMPTGSRAIYVTLTTELPSRNRMLHKEVTNLAPSLSLLPLQLTQAGKCIEKSSLVSVPLFPSSIRQRLSSSRRGSSRNHSLWWGGRGQAAFVCQALRCVGGEGSTDEPQSLSLSCYPTCRASLPNFLTSRLHPG